MVFYDKVLFSYKPPFDINLFAAPFWSDNLSLMYDQIVYFIYMYEMSVWMFQNVHNYQITDKTYGRK